MTEGWQKRYNNAVGVLTFLFPLLLIILILLILLNFEIQRQLAISKNDDIKQR